MADIPIIFSAPMVRELLARRKTMTRRLLYSERHAKDGLIPSTAMMLDGHPLPRLNTGWHTVGTYWTLSGWHKVKPGDRLWVRENLAVMGNWGVWHDASDAPRSGQFLDDLDKRGVALLEKYAPTDATTSIRIPSIYMPRWASRLTLVVTATKIEPAREISEQDALAEGVARLPARADGFGGDWVYSDGFTGFTWPSAKKAFFEIWKHLNGEESWSEEVVALTFTVHQQNVDAMKVAA